MSNEELWQNVLAEIELSLSRANYVTWFQNTRILSKKSGVITLGVPNGFTKEWLENKYKKMVLRGLRNFSRDVRTVEYTIAPPADTHTKFPLLKKHMDDNGGREESLPFENIINKETGLNNRYTFSSFVVGPSNELAYAASWSVAKKPGSTYNPLFIYGGVGLGKTHLLQAIGNELKTTRSSKNILYCTSEKFTSDLVAGIHDRKIDEFKERYRKIDVLIIDDIQFLAGKEKTQEEFFHTFNELHAENKQVILSSDRAPKAIATLEERLRSRFEGGMIADIGVPELETRIAILKTKIQERGIKLEDDAVTFIATNIQKNIRELEGALNRIVASGKLNGKVIFTKEDVERVLSSLFGGSRRTISFKNVLKAVAQFYEISEKELLVKDRRKEIVYPRQVAMFLMREELKYSYPSIGKKFGGKDHTTVMHAVEKITRAIKNNDTTIEEDINCIKEYLSQGSPL